MGRAPCCDKANVKKGPWSPEEDAKLKEYIEKCGTGGNWIALPQKAGLKRCGKSCRLRWLNYLRPNIKHGEFSDEEDKIICTLFATIGSRWSIIAAQLPGRTDNDIKNYWNTKLKKKLMSMAPPPHHPSHFPPYHHHHQRKAPFPPPSPPDSSSLLYSPLSAAQPSPLLSHNGPATFDMISPLLQSNLFGTSTPSSLFQALQEAGNNSTTTTTTSFLNSMQFYNNNNTINSSNSNSTLLVFGGGSHEGSTAAAAAASCSSNSDGSGGGQQQQLSYGTSFIKRENGGSADQIGDPGFHQSYCATTTTTEENHHSKFMLSYPTPLMTANHHHQNQNIEDQVKELMITQSSSDDGIISNKYSKNSYPDSNNLLISNGVGVDDNKAVQEKLMYYYY